MHLPEKIFQFIFDNENIDEHTLLLKKDIFTEVTNKYLASQIYARKKAKYKLPEWYNNYKIIYPEKINLEQSSSQYTAKYKRDIVNNVDILCDITGGFGVDFYYLSIDKKHNYYIENNKQLCEIVSHNFEKLGAENNQIINDNGIEYIKNSNLHFDMIYIDPSRRKLDKKVYNIYDCEPNIITHMPMLLQKSSQVLVKLSPMIDIKYLLNTFKNIAEIHVISVQNECKEILILLNNNMNNTLLLYAVELNNYKNIIYKLDKYNHTNSYIYDDKIHKYIYDPYVSIVKSGALIQVAYDYDIHKISTNTSLYFSDMLKENFPGRVFEVIDKIDKNNKKRYLVHVLMRNVKMTVQEIYKKYNVAEGNEYYLIVYSNGNNKIQALLCKIVKH
ncbi:MAG: RsmD family RNA methyltransferase [Cytophagales bacterium]|nr:RsmD family RNA methyltransferase [Cytophagales bacterium]